MADQSSPFAAGVATSSSRGIYTLKYDPKAVHGGNEDEEEDLEADEELALDTFQQAWEPCQERISAILGGLHDACLDAVLRFVHDSRAPHVGTSKSLLSALTGREPIRTGLIVGASPGSSSLLFNALCRDLTAGPPITVDGNDPEAASSNIGRDEERAALVSRISSRDCPNIKTALRAIVAGFIGATSGAEDGDDEEDGGEEVGKAADGKSSVLPPEDLQNLAAWYLHRASKKGIRNQEASLVILLEDLEGMDAKVLTQLFDILSAHAQTLPIVLLIGIATSTSALYDMVLKRSVDLLYTATFQVEPGIQTFVALIRGLFIDWEAPLALGSETFRYLLESFTDSHSSIDATISAIKYIYLRHCANHHFSVFAFPVDSDEDLPADSEIRIIVNSLPSVQKLASRDPTNPSIRNLAGTSEQFSEELALRLQAKREWQGRVRVGFGLVLIIQDHFGKKLSLENMLGRLWSGQLAQFVGSELCKLVLVSNVPSLDAFLDKAVDYLSSQHAQHPSDPTDFLDALTAHRDELQTVKAAPKGKNRQSLVNTHSPGSELLHPKHTLVQGDLDYSRLVASVTQVISKGASLAFQPATQLLLHEIWVANEIREVNTHFSPTILPNIQRRLREADSDKGEQGGQPRLDIAVAYRLYRETGKNINLADWWAAFEQAATMEPEEAEPPAQAPEAAVRSTKKRGRNGNQEERAPTPDMEEFDVEESEYDGPEEDEEEDEEEGEDDARRRKQARFLRAVGDLAYTGFLQPTVRKAKAEHVAKSVF